MAKMQNEIKITALSRLRHRLRRSLQQGAPKLDGGQEALSMQAARALTERYDPSDLLQYIDFEDGYLIRDDGEYPQIGFGFQYSPLMVAGEDIEHQFESIITKSPDDTVIQFASYSSPAIESRLTTWANRRLRYNKLPILDELVQRRVAHMLSKTRDESLLPNENLHPREVSYYIFFTIPFKGDPEHPKEIEGWKQTVDDFVSSIYGAMQSMGVGPTRVSEASARHLIRQLCNPQMNPADLAQKSVPHEPFKQACFDRDTRIRVEPYGGITFSSDGAARTVVPMTVDQYPEFLRLHMTGDLIGAADARADRVSPPYWLYTIMYKPNPEKIQDKIIATMGMISKQCMSESEWYRSMMPHIFKRRDDTSRIMEQIRSKYSGVYVWTGINVVSSPDKGLSDADYISGLWRKAGFRVSKESYISLPVWLSSLPWSYNHKIDKSNQGLQRRQLVTSINAATMAICQGDWGGNGPILKSSSDGTKYPYANGLLLTSRRGQLANIDIFESNTSYNFAIIATSGAGKSFLANEKIVDMRCRNGVVRVIDVGGSYREICELLGGQELRFDPTNPTSLNPFWGIKKTQRYVDDEGGSEIGEMIPILKDTICKMAFPLSAPNDYEYQLVEKAIYEMHDKFEDKLETKHIWEWLSERGSVDKVAEKMALQLEPYAIGRLSAWFNGPQDLDLSNPFTVLELEELNSDLELRNVVLTLLMARTTRDMYLGDRRVPKMMLVDEAWDLFADAGSGRFIETAFRRIRKYFGAAGFITQGFNDVDASSAAQAAYNNAPWKFVLKQLPASLEYCNKHSKLGMMSDYTMGLLNGLKPGPGYSEVYVSHENGSGLFRFVVDPFSHFVYSTNPKEIARLQELKSQGKTTLEAVKILAAQ